MEIKGHSGVQLVGHRGRLAMGAGKLHCSGVIPYEMVRLESPSLESTLHDCWHLTEHSPYVLGHWDPARLDIQYASVRGRKLDYKGTELTDKHESHYVRRWGSWRDSSGLQAPS